LPSSIRQYYSSRFHKNIIPPSPFTLCVHQTMALKILRGVFVWTGKPLSPYARDKDLPT
jgi:hypothetical protein